MREWVSKSIFAAVSTPRQCPKCSSRRGAVQIFRKSCVRPPTLSQLPVGVLWGMHRPEKGHPRVVLGGFLGGSWGVLGGLWPSDAPQARPRRSESPQEARRGPKEVPKNHPRGSQEAPKTPLRGFQEAQRSPQEALGAPRVSQDLLPFQPVPPLRVCPPERPPTRPQIHPSSSSKTLENFHEDPRGFKEE